jgi:hypothetical protein
MATTYRELMTITGDFARVQIFPVRAYQYGRKKKNKPTVAAQAKLNAENRTRKLADIINLNFTKKDIQIKLDYAAFKCEHGRNPSPEECNKYIGNFMRRLKRLYANLGVELKYVYASEIGIRGHISHHHVIINAGASYDQIRALWHEGGIWTRNLYFNAMGAYELAGYFVKSKYTYRSYTCSRNLKRPQESGKDKAIFKNDYKIRQKHVNTIINGEIEAIRRMYPGWEVACLPEVSQVIDTDTGEMRLPKWGVFISIHLYKPEAISDYDPKYEYDPTYKGEREYTYEKVD